MHRGPGGEGQHVRGEGCHLSRVLTGGDQVEQHGKGFSRSLFGRAWVLLVVAAQFRSVHETELGGLLESVPDVVHSDGGELLKG